MTLTAHDFAQHADAVVATMPLRHLDLLAINEAPEVFDVPSLDQSASLEGSNQIWFDEALSALTASRRVRSLRWLDLRPSGLTDGHVHGLAGSQSLKGLDQIDLRGNPC